MRKWYLGAAVLIVIVGVVVAALIFAPLFSGAGRGPTTKITDPKRTSQMALGFVAPPYQDDFQVLRLSGYVENLGKQTLARVDVEIPLTDEKGSRKEVVKQTLTDIPPLQRKTFDVSAGTFKGSRNATIKIVSVEVAR